MYIYCPQKRILHMDINEYDNEICLIYCESNENLYVSEK